MIKNYFKIALRTLLRHRGFAFINVAGLAVGLACCVLILAYVRHEWSYDRHHENADRIYRLVLDVHTPDETAHAAVSVLPFGPALKAEYPEVLGYVRFHDVTALIEHEGRRFQEDHVLYTDGAFFDVFTFPLAEGDPATALAAPYSMVLTDAAARKYFGRTGVVGQTLRVDNADTYTVTGVLREVPNTHLRFDVLLSLSTWEAANADRTENWTWHNFYTYLLLPGSYDPARLEARLPDFVARQTADLEEDEGVRFTFALQPLTDIYLRSGRVAEIGLTGNLNNLYLFSLIAGLILLVACVNFMNLATARSAQRAREVGLRKVVGARRRQVAGQFLGESVLMSLLALMLALVLGGVALPVFNALVGGAMTLGHFLQGPLLAALVVGVLCVGLLAGSYPAVVLSGFRPALVLKGRFRSTREGRMLRKGLVVFQFAVSIVLIAGTLIVSMQLDYLRSRDLGFDKEQVLVLDFRGDAEVQRQYEAVKEALAAHPAVLAATASDFTPGSGHGAITASVSLGNGQTREDVFAYILIDYDFLDTYGIEVVAGRGFSRDFPTDATEAFLINEAAVARYGWSSPEEALGRRVRQWGRDGQIVGVVKDFHYESLHHAVAPLFMHVRPDWFRYLSLRIRAEEVHPTVAELEQIWQAIVPQRPFEFTFLDERFDRQYQADARFGRLFSYCTVLAILVACLGLFGLAAFTAEQRTTEVGVRKVLGATVPQLVLLMAKDLTGPVAVAFVVAAPVAYVAMHHWLAGFAYRVAISWEVLLLAGGLALLGALLTVSYQAIRAALADPVKSLRYD